MRSCAICHYLRLDPRPPSGEIGLWTSVPAIVARATEVLAAAPSGEQHVMVAACGEHVVEIYRERIPGLRMAWRIRVEPAAPALA